MKKFPNLLLILLMLCHTKPTGAQVWNSEQTKLNPKALRDSGAAFFKQHNFLAARQSYLQLLNEVKKTTDTLFITAAYLGIARNDVDLDNYAEGLEYCFLGLTLAEKTGDKKSMMLFYQYAGYFYMAQGQYTDAISYYQSSLPLTEALGLYADMGEAYSKLGDIYYKQRKYAEAGKVYSKALDYFTRAGSKHGIANTVEGMGDLNRQEGIIADSAGLSREARQKYFASLQNNLQGMALMKELKNTGEMALACSYIADIYMLLKMPARAKAYLDTALSLATQAGLKGDIKAAYEGMVRVDTVLGNYKKAYLDYTQFILYRDSLINQEVIKQSLTYKMQYEAEKKEALQKAITDKKEANQARARDRQFLVIAILGSIVVAVVSILLLLYRNIRHKQKANKVLEKTLLDLRSTQTQLIHAEKMASLGMLTAGIAHEIQNPLNFVNNFSEINAELIDELQAELQTGNTAEAMAITKDLKENEAKIKHHGQRADLIVKGMLEHSRTGTAKNEPTDINKLTDEYLRLAYHGFRAKDKSFNANLQTEFDQSIGNINLIRQDIGRVLLNIINNALYAVAEKKKQQPEGFEPVVAVSTRKVNGTAQISITDNGIGIPEKMMDKIFQPFFTTKPTGQGTGLGLSLAWDMVKAHGGELTVDSQAGSSSTFTIRLSLS